MREFVLASDRFGYEVPATIHGGFLQRGSGHRADLMGYRMRALEIWQKFTLDD